MTTYDTIVRGGQVVTAAGVGAADVAIADGVIVTVAPEITGVAGEEIEARGWHMFPGAVDAHVHFNEPGRTGWEGWATGSAACAVGGTTTVAEMPLNADPPTLDGPSFAAKRAAAERSSRVDFALWGGLTPDNVDCLEELAHCGVIGFKAFMSNSGIAEFRAADDATLLQGMRIAAKLGLPVAVHAENDNLTAMLSARAVAAGRTGMRDYLDSRPVIAEIEAISRAIFFAEETGCTLHVVHVSTGRGVALIAAARARGIDVSAETCPHYLIFDEDDAERLGALTKCAPPLRPRVEIAAIWQALARGEIQIVASDHSPAPPEMKTADDAFRIWGGISGSQSLLSSLLSAGHHERNLPLPAVAAVLSDGPAARLRLAGKGRIAEGYDADLVFVALGERYTLHPGGLRYRHRHSPFSGMTFAGRIRRTMLRGETIACDGVPRGAPRGRLLKPAPSRKADEN